MHARTILYALLVAVPALAQGGILSLSPSSVNEGSAAFTLTVNGLGFASSNILQWDGTNLPTTFVSSTQLTASITAPQVTFGGFHSIKNKVSATGTGFSNTVQFSVLHPAPVLSSISPSLVTAGTPSFLFTATGSGFDLASVIQWNGTPLTTNFVSPTSLTTTVPASLVAAGGTIPITVFTPLPGGGTSVVRNLPVQSSSPIITQTSPVAVSGGLASQAVIISGFNFNPGTVVSAGAGFILQVTASTPNQITVVVPQHLLHSTTVLPMIVTNGPPGGGSANTAIIVTGPVISTLVPDFVPLLTPASPPVTLTVNGTGFGNGDVVRVNGFSRPTTFLSSTALNFTVDGTMPETLQFGGFAVTVTRAGLLVSNALGINVGTPSFPDNVGTVTIGPKPPAPNQLFDIRVEVPISTIPVAVPSVPVTLVADLASPNPFLYSPPGSGLNIVVGPGLGSPVVLVDGLGLLQPADGTLTHHEDLSTFGVSTLRGIYRSAPITIPGIIGVWVSFVGVHADINSPIGFSVTHPSGPYFF